MKKFSILILILGLIQMSGFSQLDISIEDITGGSKTTPTKPKEATKEKAKEAA